MRLINRAHNANQEQNESITKIAKLNNIGKPRSINHNIRGTQIIKRNTIQTQIRKSAQNQEEIEEEEKKNRVEGINMCEGIEK